MEKIREHAYRLMTGTRNLVGDLRLKSSFRISLSFILKMAWKMRRLFLLQKSYKF
jgi:hypothetical protein